MSTTICTAPFIGSGGEKSMCTHVGEPSVVVTVCWKDRPHHILPVTLLCRTSGAEEYIHTYI